MIGSMLIGAGLAISLISGLALIPLLKKYAAIPITIGIILILSGIIVIAIDDFDCKQYCQCKGKDYHKIWDGLNQCECFDEDPDIKLARRQCDAFCFRKTHDYNEATGRCYCT